MKSQLFELPSGRSPQRCAFFLFCRFTSLTLMMRIIRLIRAFSCTMLVRYGTSAAVLQTRQCWPRATTRVSLSFSSSHYWLLTKNYWQDLLNEKNWLKVWMDAVILGGRSYCLCIFCGSFTFRCKIYEMRIFKWIIQSDLVRFAISR